MKKIIFSVLIVNLASAYTFAQSPVDSVKWEKGLQNVVVKGHRPLIRDMGSKQIISIHGSYLEKVGNLDNVLRMIPGMIMKGHGKFEIMGKGEPKYYVDGKEVTQQDIFTTLKPEDISKIEVEREPSSKYPEGTNAVVNISTVKPLKDFISLSVNYFLSQNRKFSHNPSVDFKMKKGIWTSSLNYGYASYDNLNKETYFKEVHHPDYVFRSDEAGRLFMGNDAQEVNWSNDLQFAKDHRVSLSYFFTHSVDKEINDETMTYLLQKGSSRKNIHRTSKDSRNLHNWTLGYYGKTGKNSTVNFTADYSFINDNSNARSVENSPEGKMLSDVYTHNKNQFHIITLNGSWTFRLPFALDSEIGTRYYHTRHPLDYLTNNPLMDIASSVNSQTMLDEVTAGYITLTRKWKRLDISVGGRYEYADTRIHIKSKTSSYTSSHHSSDFLPSANLSLSLGKGWNIQLNYQRSVNRQGYNGLNPYPVYQDSLSYTVGNSSLRPSYTDSYAVYVNWRNWSWMFDYDRTRDVIGNATFNVGSQSNIVGTMPVNMGINNEYFTSLGYRQQIGKFNFQGTVYVSLPQYSYIYLDKRRHTSQVAVNRHLNLTYNLNKSLTAFTSFVWQSRHQHLNASQRMANNWTAGLYASLWKGKLNLSLMATDILHKAHYNNITYEYMNTRHGTYGTNDLRGISLSLSLNLFNENISVKANRNNYEILNRTK